MGTVLSSVKSTPEGIPYYTYDDFTDLARVGAGGHSTVKQGYYNVGRHSRLVAVKEFYVLDEYSDREIQLLKRSSHPNIITIFGVLWDGNYYRRKPIYSGYVMEYMTLGSLDDWIHGFKDYDDRLISRWIQKIGAGLQYLHEKSIIHRDIKPKNILLATQYHLKLADFGLARVVSGRESNTAAHWIGTDSYRAPEVLASKNYGPAADVFSFGVTIWEIILREHPWQHVTTSKDSFGNDCVDLPMEEYEIHVNASNFIRRCWQTNISDRPSIAEIIEFGSNFEQTNSPGTIIPVGHQLEQIQETVTIQGNHFDSIDRTMDSSSENTVKLKTILIMGVCEDWTESELQLPYDVNGAVSLHNELYVVGGSRNLKPLYKLDEDLEWKQLADMNVGRKFFGNSCLEANGYIWVFGGINRDGRCLKSVERYDPKEDKWTLMADMSTARADAAAVFWKDRIIVCGGWSKEGMGEERIATSSAECFLLEIGEWTQFPPLPDRLYGHSLVSYGNKLILMGGWTIGGEDGDIGELESVWEIDPLQPKDGWKSLAPMKYARSFFPGVVLDQEIYAVDEIYETEIFDGKSWRDGPLFPYRRVRPAVVISQSFADRLCHYKP